MSRSVDAHVGERIRRRRWLLGLSQQEVARRLEVHWQTLQKYETGQVRIPASRLWELGAVLHVPVDYVFVGLGREVEEPDAIPADPCDDWNTFLLIRKFRAIPRARRRRFIEILAELSDRSSSP